ncbi:unnamed protein product, partial [Rotaria socialis]
EKKIVFIVRGDDDVNVDDDDDVDDDDNDVDGDDNDVDDDDDDSNDYDQINRQTRRRFSHGDSKCDVVEEYL